MCTCFSDASLETSWCHTLIDEDDRFISLNLSFGCVHYWVDDGTQLSGLGWVCTSTLLSSTADAGLIGRPVTILEADSLTWLHCHWKFLYTYPCTCRTGVFSEPKGVLLNEVACATVRSVLSIVLVKSEVEALSALGSKHPTSRLHGIGNYLPPFSTATSGCVFRINITFHFPEGTRSSFVIPLGAVVVAPA